LVIKRLNSLDNFFLLPPDLNNLFPPFWAFAPPPRGVRLGKGSVMAVDAISADRAAAADRREAGRTAAQQYLAMRAEARRDTRVEEAKSAIAARPTPAERAAENPQPPHTPRQLVDVLA
jgi:hypothetical protein